MRGVSVVTARSFPVGGCPTLDAVTEPPAPGDPYGESRDDDELDLALDELTRMVADAQVDEAVAQRRRTAWLQRQDDEELTLAAVLRDLGERAGPVVVSLETGRRHRGLITLVGPDVVGVQTVGGPLVLLAVDSVVSVRSQPDRSPVRGGDGPVATAVSFAAALERWAADRAPLVVVARSGEVTSGTVLAIGRDVVSLRLASGGVVSVPLASVSEVGLPESG